MKQAQAALAQAELNLHYTTLKAPADGVVSRKIVEVGQVVQVGQPLLALVSLADVWVTANFKETQLRLMRDGQPATVEVDGLGGKEFKGARRQHRGSHRREVQPAAAGERHRQLREGRAARAGEDRARAGPGSRPPAATRHVRHADGLRPMNR